MLLMLLLLLLQHPFCHKGRQCERYYCGGVGGEVVADITLFFRHERHQYLYHSPKGGFAQAQRKAANTEW